MSQSQSMCTWLNRKIFAPFANLLLVWEVKLHLLGGVASVEGGLVTLCRHPDETLLCKSEIKGIQKMSLLNLLIKRLKAVSGWTFISWNPCKILLSLQNICWISLSLCNLKIWKQTDSCTAATKFEKQLKRKKVVIRF